MTRPPGALRLVSFNILHGARPGPDNGVDPGRFSAAVRALDPDVLALQEVDRAQPRSDGHDLTRVAAEAIGTVSSCYLPVLRGPLWSAERPARDRDHGDDDINGGTEDTDDTGEGSGYGLALLSRFPAVDWRRLRLPRLATGYPGWDRRPVRRADEQRGALLGRFRTPSGALTVINTHLSFVPGPREAQLITLRRRLRGIDGPVLLMGDLNLRAPWPARFLGLRPLATEPTFPNERPRTQIDHILARGRWTVHTAEAVDAGLSDHRALVVEATLDH